MSEKKEPERAHLQDRPHPYCVRRPVATTASSCGLSWSERRAEQTRVGDRPGRFVPPGENPRGKKAPGELVPQMLTVVWTIVRPMPPPPRAIWGTPLAVHLSSGLTFTS